MVPAYVMCMMAGPNNSVWCGLGNGSIIRVVIETNSIFKVESIANLPNSSDRVYALAEVESGVLAGCGDGSVYLLNGRQQPPELQRLGSPHKQMIKSLTAVAGQEIWTTDVSGCVAIWDSSSLKVVQTFHFPKTLLCVQLVGDSHMWLGTASGEILRLPVREPGTAVESILQGHGNVLKGHGGTNINDMACTGFSTVYTAGSDCSLHVWTFAGDLVTVLQSHDESKVFCVKSVGQYVLSGGFDCRIVVWDAERHQQLLAIEAHRDSVRSLLPLASCGLILSGSRDRSIAFWKPKLLDLGSFLDDIEMFRWALGGPE